MDQHNRSTQNECINDFDQLKKFNNQLKNGVTLYARTQNIQILINSPQPIIEQFAQSSGLRVVTSQMKEALKQLPAQSEFLDKLMTLVQRISLNMEILRESGIGSPLLKMKDKKLFDGVRSKELLESIQSKWFKYFTKYKQLIEEWKNDKPNHTKKKYEEAPKKKVKRSSSSSSKQKKQKRKAVRWTRDEQLFQYKVFKREDEPMARGMNELEVQTYYKAYAEELKRMGTVSAYDIKHRESQMEGRSHRLIMDNVQHMVEQIPFVKPLKLNLPPQDRDDQITTPESQTQQKRIESKMSVFYHRDVGIPAEPGYELLNSINAAAPFKVIQLDAPKREDLMQMVTIMCERGQKEMQDKRRNVHKKPIKGILKKPPEEMQRQKDQFEQAKQDLEPKVKQLTFMVEERHKYTQEQILTLLNDIVVKLKEMGQEQYIVNIKSIMESKLNSKQSIINEDQLAKQRQEQMRIRQEQQLMANPLMQLRIKAYKTKHCHNYHSAKGCTRGEACNFIHDLRYPGQPVSQNPVINLNNMQIPNLLNKTMIPPQQLQSFYQNAPNILQQLNPIMNQIRPYGNKQYESL